MKPVPSLVALSDHDLLERAHHLAGHERQATAALIACLAEVDARRLYLGEGCSSLFAWCTEVLHLSGDAAYGRIEAARVARRYPIVLEALAGAHHKSKREIEHVVAVIAPKPDVPSAIRRLPGVPHPNCTTPQVPITAADPNGQDQEVPHDGIDAEPRLPGARHCPELGVASATTTSRTVTPARHRPVVAPLAPDRFKIQFTVGRATHDRLCRAQDLLRHAVPNGDPAAIFDRALVTLIEQLERRKWAAAAKPRPAARYAPKGRTIPAAVRRAVSRRDGGRCAFIGRQGRCTETGFLEFHHVVPYARGGEATERNIQLRCRAHNQHEAETTFGAGLLVGETSAHYGTWKVAPSVAR